MLGYLRALENTKIKAPKAISQQELIKKQGSRKCLGIVLFGLVLFGDSGPLKKCHALVLKGALSSGPLLNICSLLHMFHSRDCLFKLLCRSESVLTQPTVLVAQVCVTPESCWNGELDHSGGTGKDEGLG